MNTNMNCADYIRVILLEPTHPGNIGAIARSMANMSFRHLTLVNPKVFPSPIAEKRSAGAFNYLEPVRVVKSFEESISDCNMVIGSTARVRSISSPIQQLDSVMDEAVYRVKKNREKIALVFGRERTGMYNHEVASCHALVRIPTNVDFSSINLASAASIFCYTLFAKLNSDLELELNEKHNNNSKLATGKERQDLFNHLFEILDSVKFIHKKTNPKKIYLRLQIMLNKAHLSSREINILRGILTLINRLSKSQSDSSNT